MKILSGLNLKEIEEITDANGSSPQRYSDRRIEKSSLCF